MSEEIDTSATETTATTDDIQTASSGTESVESGGEAQRQEQAPKRELPNAIPYNRFSSVVSEKNQYKARAADLERQLAELTRPQQAAQQADDFPDPTKYASLDDYKAAIRDHARKEAQALASQHAQHIQQTTTQQAEVHRLVSGFNAQAQALAATNPQITQAIDIFRDLEADIHPDVFRDIVAEGPALVWDIVTNQDVMDRLVGASPLQAGRILASIGATSTPQATSHNQPMQRPAIPTTRTVTGAAAAPKKPGEMSDAEWYAARAKKERP